MERYFPPILPDELLYSAIARYRVHTLTSSAQTLAELVGGRSFSAEIDLPSRISHILSQSSLGQYMNKDDLILRHTMFPFFSAFARKDARLKVMDMMANGNRGRSPRSVLGIYGSSKGKNLYYCPRCVEEDVRTFGEPYWHRVHRAPGVLVCPYHRFHLLSKCLACGYEYKSGKHEYLALSEFCPNGHPLREGSIEPGESLSEKTMLGYALDAQEVLTTFPSYGKDELHQVFLERLKKMGLANLSGVIRLPKLGECFISHYDHQLLAKLGCEIDLNLHDNWLFRAFRNRHRTINPVEALLIIRFLFGSFQELARNLNYRYEPFGSGPWPCFNKASGHFGENVIHSFVTKEVGGDIIGKFSCDCGFTYTRRASSADTGKRIISKVLNYGPVWNEALITLSRERELSIGDIAKRLGVAKSTVANHLRKATMPLAQGGITCVIEVARKEKRAVLIALMAGNQCMTRTELRRQAREAYNWLWRNDRPWMESHIPPKAVRAKATTARKGSVDWKARDEILFKEVSKAVSDLRAATGRPERITKRGVLNMMGRPSSYIIGEKRLPRTNELLKQSMESIEDFELRKVLWSVKELVQAGARVTKHLIMKTAGLSRKRPSTEKAITDILATISGKEG